MNRSLLGKCLLVLSDKFWLKSAVQFFTHVCPMGTICPAGTEERIGREDEVWCRFAKANKNGKRYKEVEFPIFYCRPHFFNFSHYYYYCSFKLCVQLIIFHTSFIGKQCDRKNVKSGIEIQ
jgi:hypothetical protein